MNPTHAFRRSHGLCVQCGNVETSNWRCSECSAINNQRIQRVRNARKQSSRCILCDSPKVTARFCGKCRDKVNRGARRQYFQKTMQQEANR